jgi:hypothetical protein
LQAPNHGAWPTTNGADLADPQGRGEDEQARRKLVDDGRCGGRQHRREHQAEALAHRRTLMRNDKAKEFQA